MLGEKIRDRYPGLVLAIATHNYSSKDRRQRVLIKLRARAEARKSAKVVKERPPGVRAAATGAGAIDEESGIAARHAAWRVLGEQQKPGYINSRVYAVEFIGGL